MLPKEFGALGNCMRVAGHLPDVLELHSVRSEEHMADAKLHCADDLEVVLRHEVVHGGHAPDCGVLYRKHAIVAHPLLHG